MGFERRDAARGRKMIVWLALLGAAAVIFARRRRPQEAPEEPRGESPRVPAATPAPGSIDAAPVTAPAVSRPAPAAPLPPPAPRVLVAPTPAATLPAPRSRVKALALAGVVILCAAAALAVGLLRDGNSEAAPPPPMTGEVLGAQKTRVQAAPRASAAPSVPRATSTTQLRARGRAILRARDVQLAQFAGARVTGASTRVDAVVGPEIFWIGRGSRRLLVHLQGPGTRYAVRRGQRLTFPAVVARTRPGAARAWGLSVPEGRRELARQGHHLEVYGPDIRFDCVQRCARTG